MRQEVLIGVACPSPRGIPEQASLGCPGGRALHGGCPRWIELCSRRRARSAIRSCRPHRFRRCGGGLRRRSCCPGDSSPRSTTQPNGTRGSFRWTAMPPRHRWPAARHRDDALFGHLGISGVALEPDPIAAQDAWRPRRSCRCRKTDRAPCRPDWSVTASRTRCNSASGFCVGCALRPAASRIRSPPPQIGIIQSLRI